MKLSKYFLSAFAFMAAIGGSIAYTFNDYAVSMGGSIIPIAEQNPTCDKANSGPFCQGVSIGGTTYQLFDDLTSNGSNVELSSRLQSNTQQPVVRPVQ